MVVLKLQLQAILMTVKGPEEFSVYKIPGIELVMMLIEFLQLTRSIRVVINSMIGKLQLLSHISLS